jgi:hypothetical protein
MQNIADINRDDPFSDADETWEDFQQNLKYFVNNLNPETATVVTPITWRTDWELVKEVLNGDKPISDLDGCE